MDGTIEALQGLDSLALPAIDVAGARETITRTVRIAPPRGVSSPEVVEAAVTIEIQPVQGTVRFAVPITIQGGPANARLNEAAVLVSIAGPLPVLNALTATDIRARVVLNATSPGTYPLAVRVEVPANTRVVSVQPETVSVTIP
jgi:YbbR domain-containing protein